MTLEDQEYIEQEIWNDFKYLSKDSYRGIHFDKNEHYEISDVFSERKGLTHYSTNKKIQNDEDYKIDKFLLEADINNIDWNKLSTLYPTFTKIELPQKQVNIAPPKFRTIKEREDINILLLDQWEESKQKLYSKIPTEVAAKEYLINIRWDNKPICPHCSGTKIYVLNVYNSFKCSKCGCKFSEKVGTIFQGSKLSLLKWYEAMYLLTSIKTHKISTYQLSRAIDVTQTTAWGMAQKVQSRVKDDFISKISNSLFKK